MRNDRKKPEEQDQTPITDGDARPDMQGVEDKNRTVKRAKNEKDFSENRAADVNSLEDYKDKKSE